MTECFIPLILVLYLKTIARALQQNIKELSFNPSSRNVTRVITDCIWVQKLVSRFRW